MLEEGAMATRGVTGIEILLRRNTRMSGDQAIPWMSPKKKAAEALHHYPLLLAHFPVSNSTLLSTVVVRK